MQGFDGRDRIDHSEAGLLRHPRLASTRARQLVARLDAADTALHDCVTPVAIEVFVKRRDGRRCRANITVDHKVNLVLGHVAAAGAPPGRDTALSGVAISSSDFRSASTPANQPINPPTNITAAPIM